MKQIFKYHLGRIEDILELPVGSEIVSFNVQRECACMWVHVDPSVDEKVRFHIKPVITGGYVPEDMAFIGTALFSEGDFVLHYYIKEAA